MEEQGVTEPSQGPWASLVVLARKEGGSARFRVGYRKPGIDEEHLKTVREVQIAGCSETKAQP